MSESLDVEGWRPGCGILMMSDDAEAKRAWSDTRDSDASSSSSRLVRIGIQGSATMARGLLWVRSTSVEWYAGINHAKDDEELEQVWS